MKKIFALLAFALLASGAYAQKPVAGDKGITFGFNGLSNLGVTTTAPTGTLLFRYYMKDNMAARIALNFGNSNLSTEMTDDSGTVTTTSSKSNSWSIAVGGQMSMGSIDKLEPYIGADILVGSGKTGATENKTLMTNGDFTEMKVEPGSTFSWGIIPCMGFNYFISDHFALGAEFGWGIGASNTGEGVSTTTVKFGSTTVITTTKTPSSKGMTIGGNASGLITISAFFD